jgi:hypothetical protein
MQKKMISHNILGYNPFTVEFVNHSIGTTVVEKYAVALTKKEIEAEYDYVLFPPNKLQQLIDLQNECELNSLENQSNEQ